MGNLPTFTLQGKNVKVGIETPHGTIITKLDIKSANFIERKLISLTASHKSLPVLLDFLAEYTTETSLSKENLLHSETWSAIRDAGLLLIRF